MTQFENLGLLYDQFFNLADEIKIMVENEDYSSAFEKLIYKDKLIKKLYAAKKTAILSKEDEIKLHLIEAKLQEKEHENIALFDKIKNEIEAKLSETKKKYKVGQAYGANSKKNCGVFVDYSE